ncbi:hypothetical protein Q2T76_02515 [Lactobacillus sp. YT155]|uniref:hypothetical protein n=1 Tax=Lactobacillus sp. YT155 TaxID=3060955 RepID=UPI00265D8F48|nr:hypothetical protein [Lactobacillus sp. YT155]MDO1604925.1 hypothetical protein [Lactobacillus sp. YT155]
MTNIKKKLENLNNITWDFIMLINVVLFLIFTRTGIVILPFIIGISCYLFKEYGYEKRFKKLNMNRRKKAKQ